MAGVDLMHPFGCGQCGKSFVTAKEYRVHLTLHRHEQVTPDLECTVCGKVSKTSNSFRKHAREHLGEYECHVCKQNFATDALRNVHLKSKHDIIFDSYTCQTCNEVCGTAEEYLSHMKLHETKASSKSPKTSKAPRANKSSGKAGNPSPKEQTKSVRVKSQAIQKHLNGSSAVFKDRSVLGDDGGKKSETFSLCENCGKLYCSLDEYREHLSQAGECEGNALWSDPETGDRLKEDSTNADEHELLELSFVYDSESEHNYCKVTYVTESELVSGEHVGIENGTNGDPGDGAGMSIEQPESIETNEIAHRTTNGTLTCSGSGLGKVNDFHDIEQLNGANSEFTQIRARNEELGRNVNSEFTQIRARHEELGGNITSGNRATNSNKKPRVTKSRMSKKSQVLNDEQCLVKNGISKTVVKMETDNCRFEPEDQSSHKEAVSGMDFVSGESFSENTENQLNVLENDENEILMEENEVLVKKGKMRGPNKNKQTATLPKLWCDLCERSFSSLDDFQNHHKLLEHSNNSKWVYICDICGERFLRLNDWSIHSEKVHKHFPLKCDKCGYSTAYQWRLTEHIKVRHGFRRLKCPHCPKRRFYYNKELKEHMRGHTDDRPFQCGECQRTFRYRGDLSVHQRTHSSQRPYTCTVCGHGCIQRSDLKVHMRRHTGERPYQCGICSKGFAIPGNLRVHIKKLHPTVDAFLYPCSVCHIVFRGPTLLKRHMMLHNGVKPLKCAYCQSEFASITLLDKHVLEDHGNKNFSISDCKLVQLKEEDVQSVVNELTEIPQDKPENEVCDTTEVEVTTETNDLIKVIQRPHPTERKCYHCNRIFMYEEDFERHMEQHKNSATLRPVCTVCHEHFTSLKAYDEHMQKLHTDDASHECPLCQQKFLHFWGLKNHMYKVHKKQIEQDRKRARPKCEICGKEFDKPSQMVIHLRSHSGEKPYPCPQCPKRFATATLCKQHVKTHKKKKEDIIETQVPSVPTDADEAVLPVTNEVEQNLVASASQPSSLPQVDSIVSQASQVLYMTLPCKADDLGTLLASDMSLSQPVIPNLGIPDIQLAHDDVGAGVKLDGSELEHHSYSQPYLTLDTTIDPVNLNIPLVSMATTVPVADVSTAATFTDLSVGQPSIITINDISSVLTQPIVLSQTGMPSLLDTGELVSIATIVKPPQDTVPELQNPVCVPQVSDYQTMPIQEHFKFGVTPEQLEKVSEVYEEEQLQDIPDEYDNSSDLQQDVTRVYDGYKMEQIEVYDPAEVQMLD